MDYINNKRESLVAQGVSRIFQPCESLNQDWHYKLSTNKKKN